MTDRIFVGGGGKDYLEPQSLLLKYGNRHGLIAGATGTGKTVTLQILAESFSDEGVPVFMADVKGDLAGLSKPGSESAQLHSKLQERAKTIGMSSYQYKDYPVVFWDLFGKKGHPIRTTISDMGPLLLSRLMGLSEAQEGVLNIAFRLADEQGLLLLDMKDLRALLLWMGEHAQEISNQYGNVSSASVGAIQRELIILENQGADQFFGEPALDLADMMVTEENGRGRVNILAAEELMASPALYSTFLLWLLSELFENLPEVGDPEKPKFVFFFDEAHLLFEDAPKALVNKVEQVSRLIRSKGVGVYFISQYPDDIPDSILGQLGNRIQHALRAFTPRDQKSLAIAAETFRPNPGFDTAEAIQSVGVGEAVVSLLEDKGVPSIVERTLIRPPSSQLGPISNGERAAIMGMSAVGEKYAKVVDRESASEILEARMREANNAATLVAETEARHEDDVDRIYKLAHQINPGIRAQGSGGFSGASKGAGSRGDSFAETMVKSMVRSIGTRAGTAIVRSILGSISKR